MKTALTIAGSDSSSGAGIQSDLKTFSAHRVYGTCAITAVTAQNTLGISVVHSVPADMVLAQIEAIMEDITLQAAKTGMLASRDTVEAVADCFKRNPKPSLVVDPIIVSSDGTPLLPGDAVKCLIQKLLPLAACVTPNRSEAELLSGKIIKTTVDAHEAARCIVDLAQSAVIITGGHFATDDVVDVLCDGHEVVEFPGKRVLHGPTRGTGCTFSAALTAALTEDLPLTEAIQAAKSYTSSVIRKSISIGHGCKLPVHF